MRGGVSKRQILDNLTNALHLAQTSEIFEAVNRTELSNVPNTQTQLYSMTHERPGGPEPITSSSLKLHVLHHCPRIRHLKKKSINKFHCYTTKQTYRKDHKAPTLGAPRGPFIEHPHHHYKKKLLTRNSFLKLNRSYTFF